ncbi:MAG: precorrin-2 C(20)-methyltransferase [Gluconacetobacter diazotrophicus]|nr:precorrin-2 C(20)-methyltransferase [Gluconacetobacter diazotrophicus]
MNSADRPGTLRIVGMGPGDPELMTVKAARLLAEAPAVAFFHKRGRRGHARQIAGALLRPDACELAFEYPFTTELSVADPAYAEGISRFYDGCADRLAAVLGEGSDALLLCEGDPFFFGSAMYLFDRLRHRFPCEVVPGVTGMSGCWSAASLPFVHGDDTFAVLPGTLEEDRLAERLGSCDAAVIMKVGRNMAKIRRALRRAGLENRAVYVERGTQDGQVLSRLVERDRDDAPYFSMVLVPGRRGPR